MTPKNCQYCFLEKVCFYPADKASPTPTETIENHIALQRNDVLCKSQQKFTNLYIVHSGALKAWEVEIEGKLRINNFYLPGEVLGLEVLYAGKYPFTVSAITATTVCEITTTKLAQLFTLFPEWREQVFTLLSRRLNMGNYISRSDAEQKLAGFLLELCERLHQKNEVILPMSRQDIANYLGLAPETVTRILARFEDEQLIHSQQKQIKLLKKPQLERLVQGENFPHS